MDIRKFAKDELSSIFGDAEDKSLYRKLVLKQQVFSEVLEETFNLEYLAAKLAITTVIWKECCKENNLIEGGQDNIFFEFVMQCFGSPKMTHLASAFSEYMYASDNVSRSEMCVAVTRYMFKRLKMEDKVQRGNADAKMSPAFETIVLGFEGYRNSFENRFNEFHFSTFDDSSSAE